MQSIDVTDVSDVTLKRDFFSVLPQAIPQFPRVTTYIIAYLPDLTRRRLYSAMGSMVKQVAPGATNLAFRPVCRVLPPGEFNCIIPEPLPACSESSTLIAVTVLA